MVAIRQTNRPSPSRRAPVLRRQDSRGENSCFTRRSTELRVAKGRHCILQSVDTFAYINSLRLSEAEANRARAVAEAGIQYNAAVLGGGARRPTGGSVMNTSSGKLLGGQKYKDFLIKEGLDDGFAARLIGKELTVDWTGQVGTTVFRLGQVQKRAGGAGAIAKISGFATDNLWSIVQSGNFDFGRLGEVLSKRLGGKWSVSVTDKGQRAIITAIRNGD